MKIVNYVCKSNSPVMISSAVVSPVKASLAVAVSIFCLVAPQIGRAMAAELVNPFPAAENLSADEVNQISAAFAEALTSAKPGTVVVWKSADSGRAGQVRVLRGWDTESGHCVELEQRFSKGNKAVYEVPYCQGQDGAWKITF